MRNNCLFINVLISRFAQKMCNTTFVFACFSTMGKILFLKREVWLVISCPLRSFCRVFGDWKGWIELKQILHNQIVELSTENFSISYLCLRSLFGFCDKVL